MKATLFYIKVRNKLLGVGKLPFVLHIARREGKE